MSLVFASRSRIFFVNTSARLIWSANRSSSLSFYCTSTTSTLKEHYQSFSTCTTSSSSGNGDDDNDDGNSKGNHLVSISSTALARGVNEVRQENTAAIAAGGPISLQTPDNSHFFHNGKPTLAYAKSLPKTFATMTNEQVIHFGELGVPEACRECIVRDIMVVDCVEYDEAIQTFHKIAKTNREDMSVAALPFYTGVVVSVTAGYVSIPLVFHRGIVEWFNEKYVTAEMPPVEDLETWLEVGSVAWNWMEPVLGQVSFFILCMQMARSQLQNLGIRPYFHWQQERRATKLVRMYPQYDSRFLANFSRCDQLAEPHMMSD